MVQKTGSVDEDKLCVVKGSCAEDAAAGGVAFARDGGDFSADERVEELGFAGVRGSYYGYVEALSGGWLAGLRGGVTVVGFCGSCWIILILICGEVVVEGWDAFG